MHCKSPSPSREFWVDAQQLFTTIMPTLYGGDHYEAAASDADAAALSDVYRGGVKVAGALTPYFSVGVLDGIHNLQLFFKMSISL